MAMISEYPIDMNNSNENIHEEIQINQTEFQATDVKNKPNSFGFRTASKNMRISIVLIKRVWKKREIMSKYIKKKTFRRKSKDQHETKSEGDNVNNSVKYVKKIKTIDPEEFTGDRKWCWDEFERHIGVSKRWDVKPALALAYIRMKRFQKLVPEARNLKTWKNPDSVFLAWDKPINKCLCPDKECFCSGNEIINEKMKIPKNCQTRGILAKYLPICNKVTESTVDTKAFLDKLVAATGGSTPQGTSFKRVTLNQEICLSRCRNYHVPEDLQNIQYLPYFVRPTVRVVVEKKKEEDKEIIKTKEEPEDDRVCNSFSCTVSTQTDTEPNGKLYIGKFSHCLFSNVEKTYLPDIRGKKLQITQYKHTKSDDPDMQVCVRNMEKLLDVKEMKMRVSKFLSSIYEIKDPGPPVRTCATQVPRRRRVCDSFKFRAPNRCGDKDYDDIPVVPWSFKRNKSLFDEMTKEEFEEDKNGDTCPCCELFAESDIDKETLLNDIINVLSLPRDVRKPRPDLTKKESDESITDVKNIVEELVAKSFEELGKCRSSCCNKHKKQKKDNTEVTNERDESKTNTQKNDIEIEKKDITDDNGNEKESVDKNNVDTNEMITEKDNTKLSISLLDTGTASKERNINEISNVKKTVKCDFLRQKKPNITSTKTLYQNKSKSVSSNENNDVTDIDISSSNTHNENDNDQLKLESDKDISNTNKINNKSSVKSSKILKEQKKSSTIQATSKDKIVLQVNASYKKASSAFSSLFKWIFDQKSIIMSQMIKKSSLMSVSKHISCTDDTKVKDKDSKVSEREVFSMRYTSSTISVNKEDQ